MCHSGLITYPIDKIELTKAILAKKDNLKKIINVVHPIIRKKMINFLKKNVKKKLVVLDVPLLIENNLNKILNRKQTKFR